MTEPSTLLIISFYLGSLIVVLLAFHDFRKNVPSYQKNHLRIAIVSTLFIIVVLVIYWGLLFVMVGLSINFRPPFVEIVGSNSEFANFRLIAPIILSIMYFGSTKACVRVAGKDICVYYRLLQVFTGFLTTPLDEKDISRVIKQNQVDVLQEFLKSSIDKAGDLGIRMPPGDFGLKGVKEDLRQAENGVSFLEDIKSRSETLDAALVRVKQGLDRIRESYLEKLKIAVSNLVAMNTSSALFADFTIRYFGILPPNQTTVSYPLIRTIAMAIIGAVPMALIYERTGSNYDIAVRVFLLSFALIAFLLWFLRLTSCSWTIEGTFLALLLGIAAGTCASIVFCLVEPKAGLVLTWVETKILRVSGTTANFGFVDFLRSIDGLKVLKGLQMGAAASFIVHCFRHLVVKRIKNMVLLFFLLIATGFFVFSFGELVWLAVSQKGLTAAEFWEKIWPLGASGAILSFVIALVSAALHIERSALDSGVAAAESGMTTTVSLGVAATVSDETSL
ncbi:MAG: hypothetical protein WCD88_18560 [Desulfobacterales bacterium]